jgi:hypothetical protein
MSNRNRILSDAELHLVAGGVRDNPWSDARCRQIAAEMARKVPLVGHSETSFPG